MPPRRFELREWLVPAALFALAALAYSPALNGQFVWDDEFAIQRNFLFNSFDGLRQIWTNVGGIPEEEHYWPLTYSVLWIEWNAWAGNPAGFHIFNFILHGLVVVQLWRLARRIGAPGAAGAAIGAALFALHPVHAEAVAWIISIKDLLAALLSLVCVELYLDGERGGWKRPAWAGVVAAAAMLCKSSPVTLAGTIAILAWHRRGRIERRDWLWIGTLGAVTLGIGLADAWMVSHREIIRPWPIPHVTDRVMQSGWILWLYLEKLAWPFGLGPAYPKFALDATRPINWLPLVLVFVATAGLWLARRKIGRAPLACWLFYGVSLAPVVGVIPFNFMKISPAADRYQYFASIGPLMLAGAAIGRMIQNSAANKIRWRCAVAALLAGLAILSWRQAAYYSDSATLFKRGIATAPHSAYMKQALGSDHLKRRQFDKAEDLYRKALDIEPNDWETVCNLGLALFSQGKEHDAAELCERAIGRGCNDSAVLSSYAWLLATTRDPTLRNPRKAVELAQRAVRNPRDEHARYWQSLSLALEADGRIAEALEAAKKARELAEKEELFDVMRELDGSMAQYERAIRR
ncbi:tetratricopeptide repeat protein [bacterium]|nr:tetratricopeptide repeat protein [bacterium]